MSTIMVSLIVKVTIILALGLGLTAILRRAPAAFRHVLLLGTLVSALLLPILLVVVPRWNVAVLTPSPREDLTTSTAISQRGGRAEPRTTSEIIPAGVEENPIARAVA